MGRATRRPRGREGWGLELGIFKLAARAFELGGRLETSEGLILMGIGVAPPESMS